MDLQNTIMTPTELLPLFSPYRYVDNQILLIPPVDFRKLEGRTIGGSRMFMLVCSGSLHVELHNSLESESNDKSSQMGANSFLDILDVITVRLDRFSPDLKAWCLFISFEFARESLKNLLPGPQKTILDFSRIPVLNFSTSECRTLEQQLTLLEGILRDNKHFYRQEVIKLYFKSFSLELGNILLAYEQPIDKTPTHIGKRDFVTLNFIKLVSKHFATEHTLQFYADKLCLSTKHLTRIIKTTTGKTPHDILCKRIVHQALAMLDDDRIPVGQIAEELHFSDQAAFCKFFKKQMGITPTAYRKH